MGMDVLESVGRREATTMGQVWAMGSREESLAMISAAEVVLREVLDEYGTREFACRHLVRQRICGARKI